MKVSPKGKFSNEQKSWDKSHDCEVTEIQQQANL